jgi:hypothetical protein
MPLFPPAAGSLIEFIQANLTADQAYSSGAAIDFDVNVLSNGLVVSAAGRFSSLRVGVRYELTASCQITHTGAAEIRAQWFNVTAAALIGTLGAFRTTSAASHNSTQSVVKAIIQPAVATEVECQMLAAGTAGADIAAVSSWAMIRELGIS